MLRDITLALGGGCSGVYGRVGRFTGRIVVANNNSGDSLFVRVFTSIFGLPTHHGTVGNYTDLKTTVGATMNLKLCPSCTATISGVIHIGSVFVPVRDGTGHCSTVGGNVFGSLAGRASIVLGGSCRIVRKRLKGISSVRD